MEILEILGRVQENKTAESEHRSISRMYYEMHLHKELHISWDLLGSKHCAHLSVIQANSDMAIPLMRN